MGVMSRSTWMVVATALTCCKDDPLADLATPASLALDSIDGRDFEPGQMPTTKEQFHGYPVLGKIVLPED